jgi:hypothetical protein
VNSTEPPDVEETKRKNIIQMALEFTAMIRIFAKESKKRIADKLEEFFLSLTEIRNRNDYEERHRSFCVWFTQNIQCAGKTLKNANVLPAGPSSYGQAAKILDVAIKVYVYYCALPTLEVSERIVPFLHGAIDTAILMHLKKSKFARGKIRATTIKDLDEETYRALQSLLADSRPETLHPVQYDDILWRLLNPK